MQRKKTKTTTKNPLRNDDFWGTTGLFRQA